MISLEAAYPSPADRIFLPPHPRWLEKSPRPCQKLRISTLIHWGECVIQFLHVCCFMCVCSYPACLCECICTTSQRCWKRDVSAKHEVEFPYMPKHCQHSCLDLSSEMDDVYLVLEQCWVPGVVYVTTVGVFMMAALQYVTHCSSSDGYHRDCI